MPRPRAMPGRQVRSIQVAFAHLEWWCFPPWEPLGISGREMANHHFIHKWAIDSIDKHDVYSHRCDT